MGQLLTGGEEDGKVGGRKGKGVISKGFSLPKVSFLVTSLLIVQLYRQLNGNSRCLLAVSKM